MFTKNLKCKVAKQSLHFPTPSVAVVWFGLSFDIEMANANSNLKIGLVLMVLLLKNGSKELRIRLQKHILILMP